jgi:hypothetical protein
VRKRAVLNALHENLSGAIRMKKASKAVPLPSTHPLIGS